MAKSIADMIREQAALRAVQISRIKKPAPPVGHHPEIRPVTKLQAMQNFMDDRNYSDKPTERPIIFDRNLIRETMMKESPDEFINASKPKYTSINSLNMNMFERQDDNPYKTYEKLNTRRNDP